MRSNLDDKVSAAVAHAQRNRRCGAVHYVKDFGLAQVCLLPIHHEIAHQWQDVEHIDNWRHNAD